MKKLKDELKKIIANIDIIDDDYIQSQLIEILYNHTEGNLLPVFMVIDELSKKEQKQKINEMYQGLQDGMHNMTMLSRELIDGNIKEAKLAAKFIFEDKDGNIASLINIAKTYFINGTSEGCSNGGVWWFDMFLRQLKANREKYLEGGESHKWAINYNHLEYIKLVLDKNI